MARIPQQGIRAFLFPLPRPPPRIQSAPVPGKPLLALALLFSVPVLAEPPPRALPVGQLPDDHRLGALRTYNDSCNFDPPATLAAWKVRAERVRRQVMVSLGLWPLPARTPLQPVVWGRVDRPDYTVDKVYFQSLPGFYVTGNLYRPKGRTGRLPGILSPHGHWPEGRFFDAGSDGVRELIAHGDERFEEGGRSFLQARCVQLARMGCVVFIYDMIGYGDSTQIPESVAHTQTRVAKGRPDMDTLQDWGFFSAQAEAHLESIDGLQTWDSIRALDFLLSLPEVDADRIGCTGESGGGTQTFLLGAIDSRLKAIFPAVMVSGGMQGGCSCENASDLRIGTSNLEIAALFAPKPMGMTAADDWTVEMPTRGYPELQRLWGLYGARDRVALTALPQFKHNFNAVSRVPMYDWFNRWFRLGLPEPVIERDFRRLSEEEASVWGPGHPRPPGGPGFERALLRQVTEAAARRFAEATRTPEDFRRVAGGAVDVLIGRNLDEVGPVRWTETGRDVREGCREEVGLLRNVQAREEFPVIRIHPARAGGRTILWLTGQGKAGLYDGDDIKPAVRAALDAGCEVIGADLFMQGEFLPYGVPIRHARQVDSPFEVPAYTYCYNDSLFAQRVHDILTLIASARAGGGTLGLVAVDGAGPLGAAALDQSHGAIDRAALETGGFRFSRLLDVYDPNFLPGGARYGDLPGMLALAAPTRVENIAGSAALEPAVIRLADSATP